MSLFDLTEVFAISFGGREDAYFDCNVDKREGYFDKELDQYVYLPGRPTVEAMHDHLYGDRPIGVYCKLPDDTVHWGCIDIDTGDDTPELAQAMSTAWEYGLSPVMETSRSKGYHLWFLTEHRLPASVMRRSLLHIVDESSISPTTEVNPKQEHLEPEQVGNCVRIPMPRNAAPGRQRFYVPDNQHWTEVQGEGRIMELLLDSRLPTSRYEAVADLWTPPEPRPLKRRKLSDAFAQIANGDRVAGTLSDAECAQIFAGVRNIQNGERDNQFYTLAKYMRGRSIPYLTAVDIMTRVWERQTPDKTGYSMQTALKKVDRVYR